MSCKLSVLLPNYNNAPFLKDCFDSIFKQTFQDFEIIVVDDGSTDGSKEILNELSQQPKVKVIFKENNSGIVDTMNVGLDHVNSDYVIRMDGDDLMPPERFEILVNFMDEHPDVGVCGSAIRCFGITEDLFSYPADWKLNKANLVFGHSVGHASCIFRASLFTENNIRYTEDFKLMEDYDLFYRLKDLVKMTSVSEELYLYRITEKNEPKMIVQKKKPTFIRFFERVLSDLGITYANGAHIHFEILKEVDLTFGFSDYEHHLNLLLEANEKNAIYPDKEFKDVIENALNKLTYRAIDQGKYPSKKLLSKPGLLKYALSRKIKK